MKHLGISFFSALMLAFSCFPQKTAEAKGLVVIKGSATFDDGKPVIGADVLLLEGHQPGPGELPAFTPFSRAVTDKHGAFEFEVKRKKAVIVELIRDRCDWFGVRISVDDKKLRNEDEIDIKVDARKEVCN